jgi:hypothetical protein
MGKMNKKGTLLSHIPWWLLTQLTMLILGYAVFPNLLPWWVVWFPTLTEALILAILLSVLLFVVLLGLLAEVIIWLIERFRK